MVQITGEGATMHLAADVDLARLNIVQHFVEQSRRPLSAQMLEGLIVDITREIGFDLFALVHHVDLTTVDARLAHMNAGRLVAMTNYPDAWARAYVARNIVVEDPIHLASHRTNVGFRWDDIGGLIDITPAHRALCDETRRAGISDGFTVPANVPGEANGSCSFAMRVGRPRPERNLAMAQLVGAFAFEAARTLVRRAADQSCPLRPVRLTDRQLECVLLVARGKTDWEISRILGISEETVKVHVREARSAYDVTKRMQVVLRAMYDGHFGLADTLRH